MNVENTTLSRKGRVNVVFNKLNIIESIAKNEPYGRHTMDIANDTKLHRDTINRLCKRLQIDGYIFRKNKQSEYHVTKKAYGYPELTAFSFGRKAIKTIYDVRERVSSPNEFCIDEFCKNLLRSNNNKDINNTFEANRDLVTLLEFATRLGAIIEYIMIQALRPKKIFPNREEQLVDLDAYPIKGKDKDDISRRWVENAIKPTSMLFEFCRLPMVKRGLAIFADKGKHGYIDPSLRSKPKIQKHVIEERKKMRKMDIDDPFWSAYDMDEENFKKLSKAFANAFPEIHEKLEKMRKDLPADIESNIEMAKEERKRIKQLEKADPEHVKCNGELVADFRYKEGNHKICSKCGRRLLKN